MISSVWFKTNIMLIPGSNHLQSERHEQSAAAQLVHHSRTLSLSSWFTCGRHQGPNSCIFFVFSMCAIWNKSTIFTVVLELNLILCFPSFVPGLPSCGAPLGTSAVPPEASDWCLFLCWSHFKRTPLLSQCRTGINATLNVHRWMVFFKRKLLLNDLD